MRVVTDIAMKSDVDIDIDVVYLSNIDYLLSQLEYSKKKVLSVFQTRVNYHTFLIDFGLGLWLKGVLVNFFPLLAGGSRKRSLLDKVVDIKKIFQRQFDENFPPLSKAISLFISGHLFYLYEFFKTDKEYFDYELLTNIILRYSPLVFDKTGKTKQTYAQESNRKYSLIYAYLKQNYKKLYQLKGRMLNLDEFVEFLYSVIDFSRTELGALGYVLFVKYVSYWERHKEKRKEEEFERIYFDDRIKTKKKLGDEEDEEEDDINFVSLDEVYDYDCGEKEDEDDEAVCIFSSRESDRSFMYVEEDEVENRLLKKVVDVMHEILTQEELKAVYLHFFEGYDFYNKKNAGLIMSEMKTSCKRARQILEGAIYKLRIHFALIEKAV